MIGKTISHYKIVDKLGEGGMGVVYKAEDTKLKRIVALKFLPTEFTRDKEAKKRFLHEAQAASALDHNNICAVYEIDETDEGQMFLAMACYEGETLRQKIEKGPLKINEALKVAIQVAEGLTKAHQKEIVHRDIKSANILITDEGIVKILDFGLAKLRGQTKLTKEGTTLGTVAYMSPEQTAGEEADQRSDIWSLGVLLYEMITGRLPFKGEYEQAIMYAIMNEEPEPVTGLRTGVPMELEKIINKALSKNPSERYQHADELIVDLKRVKKDTSPKMASVKYKTPETRPKPGRRYVIPGIIILAVIMIIAGYLLLKPKPEQVISVIEPNSRPSLAVIYFENKSGDENLDNWRDAFSELITTDLSQSKYIRVLRSDQIYGIFKKLNLLEAKRYSEQDLQDISKRGRVNHILKGSYIKAGENFVITATLINTATGKTISSLSIKAEGEKDIFPKIDELTREVKHKLNITPEQINSDIDNEVGLITTSSPEAFKYYLQGRKYLNKGKMRDSIKSMEKAVFLDPGFAMAYRSMAASCSSLGLRVEQLKYLKRAMDLSDRLSALERYTIQGDYYFYHPERDNTYDKAIESYDKALQLYPYNGIVNTQLGNLYLRIEEWDKAIERYDVLIQNKEPTLFSYYNINEAYQAKGMVEKGIEVLKYYLNNFQDHFYIRFALADNYIIQRKFDLALSEVEKAPSLRPNSSGVISKKGYINLYSGDFKKVEKICQKLLKNKDKRGQFRGRWLMGRLYLLKGRYAKAEDQFRQAKIMAKKRGLKEGELASSPMLGYVYFQTGKYEESLRAFDEYLSYLKTFGWPLMTVVVQHIKAIILLKMKSMQGTPKPGQELLECVKKKYNKKFIRYYHNFLGQKELERNNFSKAIGFFKQAISLLPGQIPIISDDVVLFIDPLALAYFKSGNMDNAQKEYEKITSLTVGRLNFGDIYAKSFYMLGKIYQQKGWKGKAIDHYKKFIELWKDCDPPFQPLVEDARKRLKELEGRK